MFRRPLLPALLGLALAPSASGADPVITNHSAIPGALKEAQSLRVPALIVLAKATATPPTYADARVVHVSRSFACATVPLTPALAKQYELAGDFHILLLDADGATVEKFGADVTPDALLGSMVKRAAETRNGFVKVLRSDSDAKEKKKALVGLLRIGATAAELLPLLADPSADLKAAARKGLAALPADAVVLSLLDAMKSDDAVVRTAVYPLAVQVTGYTAAPLKVWQTGTDAERAAAWAKWNAAALAKFYPLNKAVVAFCEKHLGEQVSDGICASLVVDAYAACGARPKFRSGKTYVWGRPLQPGEPVLPGDIAQYADAKFTNGDIAVIHTSVIRKVIEPDKYEILQQNTTFGGKKVHAGTLDLSQLTEGSLVIYRPQK